MSDLWADNIPHISYTKGPVILEMLESVIGERKMQNILRSYVKMFQFQSASTMDFLKLLRNETAVSFQKTHDYKMFTHKCREIIWIRILQIYSLRLKITKFIIHARLQKFRKHTL